MGRKTWESIPEKFRPLADRINIIISRTWSEAPSGAYLASGLEEAVELCSSGKLGEQTEGLFIIGGSSIYELALSSPLCHRIYYTQVMSEFECDTFLSDFDRQKFKQITVDGIDGDIKEENGIKYRFEVYENTD